MNEFHFKNKGFCNVEHHYNNKIKRWLNWIRGNNKRKSKKYIERIKAIVESYSRNTLLEQVDVSRITGIPKSTVNRIVKELVKIGALRKVRINIANINKFRYEVDPVFIEFINTYLNTLGNSQFVQRDKGRGFSVSLEHEWYKDGWFRIHGFQRKWVLRNYKLIEDDEKWNMFALLIDDKPAKIEKVRIGRKCRGVAYLVEVFSQKFKTHFLLQFRSNSLIISLPQGESIWVPWDEFDKNIEEKLVEEIDYWASRAVKVYQEVFNQQVLAYDDGWVGKKDFLKPKVAYIDPYGVIRRVYDVAGAVYIESLGYWIDGSLSPTNPELEFDTIEEASKFKKAVDILASGELDARIESIDRKINDLNEKLNHIITIIEELKMKN